RKRHAYAPDAGSAGLTLSRTPALMDLTAVGAGLAPCRASLLSCDDATRHERPVRGIAAVRLRRRAPNIRKCGAGGEFRRVRAGDRPGSGPGCLRAASTAGDFA